MAIQVWNRLLEVIKISRPGFYLTHLWFFLLPFSGRDVLHDPSFWLGCCYVTFPLGLLLYGWNDIGDAATDEINPRKNSWLFGARPDVQMRRQLPMIIALVQIPCVAILVLNGGWRLLLWFVAVLIVNAAYNVAFKKMPVLDLLNQAGYLLIFVLASWLCNVPQLNQPAMVFSALFAMQSHLFGQIMDYEEDRIAGRHSTAVVIGVVRAKWLLVLIMFSETVVSGLYFSSPLVSLFMGLGTLFFVLDAHFGPRHYPVSFIRYFFIGWNIIVLLTMHFVWQHGLFTLGEGTSS